MLEDRGEKLKRIRASLYRYAQVMIKATGRDYVDAMHIKEICCKLTDVVLGKCPRLIINLPPRAGKTEIAVKLFISWCMGLNPACQFIHTTYSHRLAASNASQIRGYMLHPVYQEMFGYDNANAPKLSEDSRAKDEFRTVQGGCVYSAGAGGSITGFGAGSYGGSFAGAIVVDDIHKAKDAQSDIVRQSTIDWFANTLESRKNSPDTPIIVVGQRLHESDLAGWLLQGGNGEEWELLKIAAINNEGKSFWEEQFPLEMLQRMEQVNPYVFAGQYMQDPAPKGGGDFKVDEVEIVDSLPEGLTFVRGWDLAATVKKTSDYTASVKMGVKDGIIYVTDVFRFKGRPEVVEKHIVATAKEDGLATTQSIPQDPGQAGVAQKRYLSRRLSGFIFEFSTESGDKRSRAAPFAAQVNVGNVRLLRGPWNNEFLHEMSTFPLGANDDMVDAASRAFNKVNIIAPTVVVGITRR